jgi:hypothetical protein
VELAKLLLKSGGSRTGISPVRAEGGGASCREKLLELYADFPKKAREEYWIWFMNNDDFY